jgi:anti-sigma factor RsiW
MNKEQQLKLQGFLDGELPEKEAHEVSAWVAQDAEATALLKEMRNTRQTLKQSEPRMPLPESREFYWSKIQREIERSEPRPAPAKSSFLQTLRRILVPASAVAALIAIGLLSLPRGNGSQSEMAVADSEAFTYQDFNNGTTLVWVSYPAER